MLRFCFCDRQLCLKPEASNHLSTTPGLFFWCDVFAAADTKMYAEDSSVNKEAVNKNNQYK